jgi:sarcosine oxidase delta subunit
MQVEKISILQVKVNWNWNWNVDDFHKKIALSTYSNLVGTWISIYLVGSTKENEVEWKVKVEKSLGRCIKIYVAYVYLRNFPVGTTNELPLFCIGCWMLTRWLSVARASPSNRKTADSIYFWRPSIWTWNGNEMDGEVIFLFIFHIKEKG